MSIKLFTVAEMTAAEKATAAAGVPYAEMMERAGRAVAQAIMAHTEVANKEIVVLVGPGNNGGDGLVAGRHLAQAGADVSFYLYRPRDPEEDENFARVREMDLFHANAEDDQRYRVLRLRLRGADVIVDALLGTGVDRPIEGELAELMRQVRSALRRRENNEIVGEGASLTPIPNLVPESSSATPMIAAVDCPSGLNSDTGELDPLTIPADLTVTFAGPKRGHFIFPGAGAIGQLVVADIGIAPDLPEVASVAVSLATADMARSLLPDRPVDGHKGTFGKVLIAAGAAQYWGAPLLCARASYRAGAGLVALATPSAIRPVVAAQLPEATYPPVPARDTFDRASAKKLLGEIEDYDSFLFGPGLGEASPFVEALLREVNRLPPLAVGTSSCSRAPIPSSQRPMGASLSFLLPTRCWRPLAAAMCLPVSSLPFWAKA